MRSNISKEKEKNELPKRMQYALDRLYDINIIPKEVNEKSIVFYHENEKVTLFPFSGWFSGKTVNDGRGIHKLINQIK